MSQMHDRNQKITIHKSGQVSVSTINEDPSLTQQQFKEECDINNIMKKYQQTGQFLHLTGKQGVYSDFSELTDYQSMLHKVFNAQEAFQSLPAQVRARFQNDPGQLINFIQDKNNYDEALSLGLLNPQNPPQTNEQTQTNEPKPKQTKQTKQDPE